jgi:hypothetical protein
MHSVGSSQNDTDSPFRFGTTTRSSVHSRTDILKLSYCAIASIKYPHKSRKICPWYLSQTRTSVLTEERMTPINARQSSAVTHASDDRVPCHVEVLASKLHNTSTCSGRAHPAAAPASTWSSGLSTRADYPQVQDATGRGVPLGSGERARAPLGMTQAEARASNWTTVAQSSCSIFTHRGVDARAFAADTDCQHVYRNGTDVNTLWELPLKYRYRYRCAVAVETGSSPKRTEQPVSVSSCLLPVRLAVALPAASCRHHATWDSLPCGKPSVGLQRAEAGAHAATFSHQVRA